MSEMEKVQKIEVIRYSKDITKTLVRFIGSKFIIEVVIDLTINDLCDFDVKDCANKLKHKDPIIFLHFGEAVKVYYVDGEGRNVPIISADEDEITICNWDYYTTYYLSSKLVVKKFSSEYGKLAIITLLKHIGKLVKGEISVDEYVNLMLTNVVDSVSGFIKSVQEIL